MTERSIGRWGFVHIAQCRVFVTKGLQHAACGGMLVMVYHLRLVEIHCMSIYCLQEGKIELILTL